MPLNDKLSTAIHEYQSGRYAESELIANEILEADPENSRALNLLGMSLHERGLSEEGVAFVRKAVEINPNYQAAYNNLATIYRETKRFDLALQWIERAIALDPVSPDYHLNRASILFEIGEYEKSLAEFGKAISLDAQIAEAHVGRGSASFRLNRYPEALADFNRAIELEPRLPKAWEGLSRALFGLNRNEEALVALDTLLELDPGFAQAWIYRGDMLFTLRRYDEAVAAYRKSLEKYPDLLRAWIGIGDVFAVHRQSEEALVAYDKVLMSMPGSTGKADLADAWLGRGNVLRERGRHDEAAKAYRRLLEINPDYDFVKSHVLHQKMMICDWQALDIDEINRDVRQGKKSIEPFAYQAIANSAEDLQQCAVIYAAARFPRSPAPLWTGEKYDARKIRIGYLSGEFRNQAVSMLMAQLYELHDRKRFEVYAFDNSLDDGSKIRKRIIDAFDLTIDIKTLDDLQAAKVIRQNQIDILVNLNGYFGRERTAVFSHRPAPVQINYLGFSASMGVDYIDYILADAYVIPPALQKFYTEKVVYLPNTFQVSDSKRPIANTTLTRSELALPETGFVFCCFNNSFKITPTIFDIWMRLLKEVDGSVLWLSENSEAASNNLRAAAAKRGIAPERLVISAKAAEYPDYLARYGLADLFLDTFPFNAGTVGNDALWAGTPLLTCSGETYPARIAGSLLTALGVSELITNSLEEYEALARRLARDHALLVSIREKISRRRNTSALFDATRMARHIESAYTAMWERSQKGEPPASFSVESLPH